VAHPRRTGQFVRAPLNPRDLAAIERTRASLAANPPVTGSRLAQMSDSELVAAMAAGPGGKERSSKVSVALATSTTEVASCSPTSTTFSPHFLCWWMISCLPDVAQGDAQGSVRRSSLRSRSRRSCCSAIPSGGSCATDLPGHRAAGQDLPVVLRSDPAAGLHAGAVRPVARDPQTLRAGRVGRLRLLRLAFPLLLGIAALSAVRAGRNAGQLLPRAGNEPEREIAAAMLERARERGLLTGGEIIVGDGRLQVASAARSRTSTCPAGSRATCPPSTCR
jgi:hypothetical protein